MFTNPMSAPTGLLIQEREQLVSTTGANVDLLQARSHPEDKRILLIAFGIAVVIHIMFMLVRLPEFKRAQSLHELHNVIVVKKYVPPPPKLERSRVAPSFKRKRTMPIPDPTPDEPEPIREPEPELVEEPRQFDDVEFLIGEPEAPPAPESGGPLVAGVGGVTQPKLIPESKIQPTYPEIARKAKIEGKVIVQGVICQDGSIGELEVLQCTFRNIGFEEAAVDAVAQWRYEPAMLNGRPVAVCLTVVVDFALK